MFNGIGSTALLEPQITGVPTPFQQPTGVPFGHGLGGYGPGSYGVGQDVLAQQALIGSILGSALPWIAQRANVPWGTLGQGVVDPIRQHLPFQGGYGQAPFQGGYGQMPFQGGYGQTPFQQVGIGQTPFQLGLGQIPAPVQGWFGQNQMPFQGGLGQLPFHPGQLQNPFQVGLGQVPPQQLGLTQQHGGYGQGGYGIGQDVLAQLAVAPWLTAALTGRWPVGLGADPRQMIGV
jgi:hypothetical protein